MISNVLHIKSKETSNCGCQMTIKYNLPFDFNVVLLSPFKKQVRSLHHATSQDLSLCDKRPGHVHEYRPFVELCSPAQWVRLTQPAESQSRLQSPASAASSLWPSDWSVWSICALWNILPLICKELWGKFLNEEMWAVWLADYEYKTYWNVYVVLFEVQFILVKDFRCEALWSN